MPPPAGESAPLPVPSPSVPPASPQGPSHRLYCQTLPQGRPGSPPPPAALRRGGQHPPYSSPPWCPGSGCPQPHGEAGSCRRRVGASRLPSSLSLRRVPPSALREGEARQKGTATGTARSQLPPATAAAPPAPAAATPPPSDGGGEAGGDRRRRHGGSWHLPRRRASGAHSRGGEAAARRCQCACAAGRGRAAGGGRGRAPAAAEHAQSAAGGWRRAPARGSAGFQDGGGRPAWVRRGEEEGLLCDKEVFFFNLLLSPREQVWDVPREPLPWSGRVWCTHRAEARLRAFSSGASARTPLCAGAGSASGCAPRHRAPPASSPRPPTARGSRGRQPRGQEP